MDHHQRNSLHRRAPRPSALHFRAAAAAGVLVLAGGWLALDSRKTEAFFPANYLTGFSIFGHSHEQITTEALEALDAEFFEVFTPTGTMRAANQEIADGNMRVDEDQGHSALHFDGENFAAGQGRLITLKGAVLVSIRAKDAQGARDELGQALHTLQDFYAHSNWTNSHGEINPDLGVEGHSIQGTLGPQDPAELNGVLTTSLTSGYYHDEDAVPTPLPSGRKERHGGLSDTLSSTLYGDGLNRDSILTDFSPQSAFHEQAAALAGEATKKYIREIAELLTPAELRLLLGKGPTLGIVIDTTNSMQPIINAVSAASIQLVDALVGTAEEPSQYVLGQINDPTTPEPVVTSDPSTFKASIAGLTTTPAGVDCPEMAMTGMIVALALMDPGGQLFVFTDATAKDSALRNNVSALAQSREISVHFLLFGSCSPIDPGYIQIANETGGQLFFLTLNEVNLAAGIPGLLMGTNSVNLLSVHDTETHVARNYTVPVDSTLTEVTFSLDRVSLKVFRPDGSLVRFNDPGTSQVITTGGKVVKVTSPAVGSWSLAVGPSSEYRLRVTGSSALDLSRFRFVKQGGRSGHEGMFPIPGQPVAGAAGTADAVLIGSFQSPLFDLRRPDGTSIRNLSLAPLGPDLPNEFGGSVDLPGEPFLAYLTGQDSAGNPFQRVLPRLFQPQGLSIVAPLRQDLQAGSPTSYVFKVLNLGAADTFTITATDDKGFIASADPSQASIEAGGSADFTVVLQPPAGAAIGTSEALTVSAQSAATPSLSNFATLTSVVKLPASTAGGLIRAGDANADGTFDISDAVTLLGHLFLGTPAQLPCAGGTAGSPGNRKVLDCNGDGGMDLSDAICNLSFLFIGGAPPVLGTGCLEVEGCPDTCPRP